MKSIEDIHTPSHASGAGEVVLPGGREGGREEGREAMVSRNDRQKRKEERERGREGEGKGGRDVPHLDVIPQVPHSFLGRSQGVGVIVQLHLTGGKITPSAPIIRLLLHHPRKSLEGGGEGGV